MIECTAFEGASSYCRARGLARGSARITTLHGLLLGAVLLVTSACSSSTKLAASDSGTQQTDLGWADSHEPTYGCSADLRSVVDANEKVIRSCPPEQGCLDGACVEACAAAAASRGSIGCRFAVTTPQTYVEAAPCFAVFVANQWPRAAKLSVSRGGTSYDVTTFARMPVAGQPESAWPAVPATGLPADGVAVLFLSHNPTSKLAETGAPLTCPVAPAIAASTEARATAIGQAFSISSDTPIVAYDMLPYGGAHSHFPSAQLLYPTSAWGKNYVVIATDKGTGTQRPLWLQILAQQDGTTVELLPTIDLPAGPNFPAAPAQTPASFTLAAGQYLQWELPAGTRDASGSVVLANQEVAVFAGHRLYREQPAPKPGGDSTHQQVPSVGALGHRYVGAPYATRRADLAAETIHYRIVAAFDGTELRSEPAISALPATLQQGQVVDFSTDQAFVISSQDADHPFAMAQIMNSVYHLGIDQQRPGALVDLYDKALGDEEFVIVVPPAQFLRRYVFFSDPSYPTTTLTLTRVKGPTGFAPVTIECLGEVSDWQAVDSAGTYQVASVDLLRAGVPVGSCGNGRQLAASANPFGVVVWGLDSYSSYAYPAGGNAAHLTDKVALPKVQ